MLGQLFQGFVLRVQPRQVHHLAHAGGVGRVSDGPGGALFRLFEILTLVTHRVHEVKDHVHARHDAGDVVFLPQVSLDEFGLLTPVEAAQAVDVAGGRPHLKARGEQLRHEATAHITGGPGDQHGAGGMAGGVVQRGWHDGRHGPQNRGENYFLVPS